ncbi:thioredoxin [Bordetella petrii]|nr:thioredoxin [Bordetella petrii]
MPMTHTYVPETLKRDEVDRCPGALVLEFGTNWCGFCQAAQPLIEQAFAAHPQIEHVKVEDGSGRPLGRSFRVKLWPSLIFLRDGHEVARLVQPDSAQDIADALKQIA